MTFFFQSFHIKLFHYLYSNLKELIINPQWFIMHRLARFSVIRKWKTTNSNFRPKHQQIKSNIFTNVNVENVIANLEQYGLHQGLQLPEQIVNDILKFAYSNTCYASQNPKLGFQFHQKDEAQTLCKQKILTATYFNSSLECEAINLLQNDPILLEIAARYLNAQPVHVSNLLSWSFPGHSTYYEQSKSAQTFHWDLDDYKIIKFFFYLTDVDLYSGAHVYILESHNRKKILHQLLRGRTSEQNLIHYYGEKNVVSITGTSGWGFVEDTYGYHKGTPPVTKPRLMLQVEFATKDYGMLHDFIKPTDLKSILGEQIVA
jgi:hypothetical protein